MAYKSNQKEEQKQRKKARSQRNEISKKKESAESTMQSFKNLQNDFENFCNSELDNLKKINEAIENGDAQRFVYFFMKFDLNFLVFLDRNFSSKDENEYIENEFMLEHDKIMESVRGYLSISKEDFIKNYRPLSGNEMIDISKFFIDFIQRIKEIKELKEKEYSALEKKLENNKSKTENQHKKGNIDVALKNFNDYFVIKKIPFSISKRTLENWIRGINTPQGFPLTGIDDPWAFINWIPAFDWQGYKRKKIRYVDGIEYH